MKSCRMTITRKHKASVEVLLEASGYLASQLDILDNEDRENPLATFLANDDVEEALQELQYNGLILWHRTEDFNGVYR